MLNSVSAAVLEKGKTLQVVETSLLLVVSITLQFIIHLIPPVSGMPLGQILLPAFYAPLFALLFFRLHVALTVALLTPTLNYLITGMPRPEILPGLTIELAAFVLIAYFMLKNEKTQLISALTAVLFAKIISLAVLPLISNFNNSDFFVQSLVTAVPGILVLSVLNILLLRYKNN